MWFSCLIQYRTVLCDIACLCLAVGRRSYISQEDMEFFDIQEEMMEDLNKQYIQIDRIVSESSLWQFVDCNFALVQIVKTLSFDWLVCSICVQFL